MVDFITREDVDNYGRDLVDFSQRAAVHAVGPHLQALDQQNAELRERLAREARHRLDQEVAAALGGPAALAEIDRDPEWHSWLRATDSLSAVPRQTLLNDAVAQGNAARVIGFFRGFEQSQAATSAPQQHRASSPRASTRSSAAGRTYTRAQIAQLYSAHRKGAYVGREAEWAQQEWDIVRAGAEGRVVDPDFVTK